MYWPNLEGYRLTTMWRTDTLLLPFIIPSKKPGIFFLYLYFSVPTGNTSAEHWYSPGVQDNRRN